MMNVRAQQVHALEKMLRLEVPSTSNGVNGDGGGGQQQWKVLIYDMFCRDVISPIMTVSKLRENGVTLHMLLSSKRECIPDVPAVYFMEPTVVNIDTFVKDCQQQLYDTAHVNFSAPLSQELMDLLARKLVEVNAVNVVAKVWDQYLGFVSLEPRLASLNLRESFCRYNSPTLQEQSIEKFMNDVALGIQSVVVSLGMMPVIRCPAGGPAEMVARKVASYLSEIDPNVIQKNALEHRPMMLIVDRSVDMCAPLLHTSGYQTLVADLLEYKSNRVKVEPDVEGSGGMAMGKAAKEHGLDPENDSFWERHAGSPIHEAISEHNTELASVREAENKVKQQTGRDVTSLAAQNDGTSTLLDTVQSLPKLLEKRAMLERHLEILQATMKVVSKRQVHRFVEPEEGMIFSQYAERDKVLELASDAALSLRDKVRLLALYMIGANASKEDWEQVENAVISSSASEAIDPEERDKLVKVIAYVKNVLALSRFSATTASSPASSGNNVTVGGWDIAALTKSAFENASRQVKNMVSGSKVLPSVQLMHLACREASSEKISKDQDSQLMYLDPKVQGCEVPVQARIRSSYKQGILFVVGGGCYAEYQNLQDLASGRKSVGGSLVGRPTSAASGGRKKDSTQYLYACTELVNADAFLSQLASCAP